MIFLQDLSAGLLNYGVLGIFAALMVASIVFLVRHFLNMQKESEQRTDAAHKENEERLKILENKLECYLREDKKELIKIALDSKLAIENSNKLTIEILNLMQSGKLKL
jgi:hypothetical protein